jgi:hypothetical protein
VAVTLRALTTRCTSAPEFEDATRADATSADTDTAGMDTPTGPRSVGRRTWSGWVPGYAMNMALAPAP